MFFDGWEGIWRTALVGALAYVALVLLLRIAGKRTLTKMNAFDLVVTVALGSTLATVLLSKDVALAEGVTAFILLIVLQYVVSWSSVRWARVRQVVSAEPSLLFYRGQMLDCALREQRVREDEVRAAIRSSGQGDVQAVEAVILEADGSFSVIGGAGTRASSVEPDVARYPGE